MHLGRTLALTEAEMSKQFRRPVKRTALERAVIGHVTGVESNFCPQAKGLHYPMSVVFLRTKPSPFHTPSKKRDCVEGRNRQPLTNMGEVEVVVSRQGRRFWRGY